MLMVEIRSYLVLRSVATGSRLKTGWLCWGVGQLTKRRRKANTVKSSNVPGGGGESTHLALMLELFGKALNTSVGMMDNNTVTVVGC